MLKSYHNFLCPRQTDDRSEMSEIVKRLERPLQISCESTEMVGRNAIEKLLEEKLNKREKKWSKKITALYNKFHENENELNITREKIRYSK